MLSLEPSIITKIGSTIVILAGAIVLRLFAAIFIKTLIAKIEDDNPETSQKEQRVYTLSTIFKSAINLAVFAVMILMILSQ